MNVDKSIKTWFEAMIYMWHDQGKADQFLNFEFLTPLFDNIIILIWGQRVMSNLSLLNKKMNTKKLFDFFLYQSGVEVCGILWESIWILAKDFARICGFFSIEMVCCTLYFTRIYLDSPKSACENWFSDFPWISDPANISKTKLCLRALIFMHNTFGHITSEH